MTGVQFPEPPTLLPATAVTPPGRRPISPMPSVCVCVGMGGGDTILKRKACMGPGVGAQRRGACAKKDAW